MNPHRPNGHDPLKRQLQRPMTPEDRKLWAAKQNLPPGYVLLHVSEVEKIGQGLQMEHKTRVALQLEIEACKNSLDSYWTTQPDMVNAVDQACFDARRNHRAIEHAEKALEDAHTTLVAIATSTSAFPVTTIDAAGSAMKIHEALQFIKQQREARRDVIRHEKKA